jgi:predicted 3-demethylubiquinone-9 3-methyltransferase (glyoxalase superfamily)
MASSPQKITPFLWFDNNAEEAMNHYVSIFNNSKVLSVTRNGKGGPGPEGSVLVGSFELDGLQLNALNGGPMFKFNEAISMVVHCDSQEEVDRLWDRLCEGGSPSQCGWLKDKFGLSWQIVPRIFIQLVQDPDPAKSQRVLQAMMQMSKFDIAALQRAHRGE